SCLLGVGFQTLHPMVESQSIMFAKAFYVSYLEPASFCRSEADMERDQFAIGKHVAVDKGWLVPPFVRGRGNPGIQECPARPEQVPGPRKVLLQLRLAHVFKHPHADDLVKRPFDLKVPVVAHFDATSVIQPQFADALPSPLRLGDAQSDADDLSAIVPSRMNNQAAPPAANVQQRFVATKTQLAANVVQLLALDCIKFSCFYVGKIRGGVLNFLVEPQCKELRGKIVVIADGQAVALPRMPLSSQAGGLPVRLDRTLNRQPP